MSNLTFSQCDPEVPTIVIDLSSNPDTTWTLFEVNAPDRVGQCCGVASSQNCIRFEITLHPNSAGLFFDYDGAGAFGSLNWRIDCGAPYSLKDTICVTETGPFTLTFCKPGSDNGNYSLISVPKPTFPEDQFVPMNCIQPLEVLGVNASSVQWQSISPGTPGQYNSYLSCTNCLEPTFTPNPNGPSEIRYRVCGYPILDYCVGNFEFCDTVKVTIQDSIKLSISPELPVFCSEGSSLLTANATGGDGNYNFIWYNNALQQIGTGANYVATSPGTYTCEVRDGNFEPLFCDGFFASVVVAETFPPIINAGPDQVLCASSPNAALSATFQYASGVVWSGGNGTFLNSNTEAENVYVPTNAELASGSVTLTLSSTGVGSGCLNTNDQIQLFFVDTVETNLSNETLLCDNGTISFNPVITGGMAPLNYSWTNGATTASTTLSEGTHCLTIVDANQCQTVHCIAISSPGALDVVMSSTPVSINFTSDGTASANVSGGVAPYSYLWNNGGTTQTITNLAYGIYTVIVTDGNGCQQTGSVVVNEPRCDGFFLTTSSTFASCFGAENGSATVAINNGQAPFVISWNDPLNQNTATASNLSAGVYMVTVTDDNDCVNISTATIHEPSSLVNSMTHVDVTVQGGNDGQASVSVTGGTAPYSYLWSSGSSVQTASNLSSGIYYVSITDNNGCVLEDSVFVNEPPCNAFYALIGTTSPLCNGAMTATANLTLLNGTGPFSIEWSTGQTDVMSVTGIGAGFHSVEITDSRGCEIFQTFGISEPSAISIGMITTPSTCNGMNNGTIDVSISGGTYPYYFFNWSNGATSEDLIGLAPVTYSITVADMNNCMISASTIMTEPETIALSFSETHVTCFEGTNGAIDVSASGGTIPYNYNWSNGQTSQDLSGIDVGGYILNFSDANNCSNGEPLTVIIEQPTLVNVSGITIDCPSPGASSTLVTVTPNGGNPDYAVSFDGGTNFYPYGVFSATLPVDQTYSVLVKDANDCISSLETINIDTNVVISAADFNVCYFGSQTTETVSVTIEGGSPTYALSTDNGASFGAIGSGTVELLIGSSYQLIAKDNRNCLSLPYSITLPSIFEQITSITSNYNGSQISCNGENDGEATAVVSGGTMPYSYTWSNGQSTGVATGLTAGTYSLLIEDAEGCVLNSSVTITEPLVLTAPIQITTDYNGEDISCFGSSTGGVISTPTGGTGAYSYSWNTDENNAALSNLPAGTYYLTVTDVNGCFVSNSTTLSEPAMVAVQANITDVSCNGGNNGSIDLSVSGGVAPYAYSWNNGEATEDLAELEEGNYSVLVSDANGCEILMEQMVVDPTAIDLSLNVVAVSCHGFSDGAIQLTSTGGTSPYVFNWDNGAQSEDIDNLTSGDYSVVVTDANGCYTSISAAVSQPDTIAVSATTINPSCFGYENGSIAVEVNGGTQPYALNWSNNASAILNVGLTAGDYQLEIVDENGCVHNSTYSLTQPNPLSLEIHSPLYFHDHHISLFGENDGSIMSTISGGTSAYTYLWSTGSTDSTINGLTAGLYSLIVTDFQGCLAVDSIVLTQPFDLALPTIFTPNGDNFNDSFEILGIDAYPENDLSVVNRWGNVVYETSNYANTWAGTNKGGDPLPDGVYFVILKINDGKIEKNAYVHIKRY